MTYLETIMRKSRDDARHFFPEVKPRLCHCCGEPGEFDDFAVVHTHEHHCAMAREFGGSCCVDCLDGFDSCDRCGCIGSHSNPVRSQMFGDERLCGACEEAA